MIEIAGGEPLLSRPGEKSREASWAEIGALRPDVVVAMPCGYYVEESLRQVRPHRAKLEALGGPAIWAVDAASTFSRPGPRLVEGVELLAHLLHPDAAEPPPGIGFERVDTAVAAR
jgi:iron complex transport system substrate-binding protein